MINVQRIMIFLCKVPFGFSAPSVERRNRRRQELREEADDKFNQFPAWLLGKRIGQSTKTKKKKGNKEFLFVFFEGGKIYYMFFEMFLVGVLGLFVESVWGVPKSSFDCFNCCFPFVFDDFVWYWMVGAIVH